MASPRPPSLAQAHHYRLPELLHDIRLLDLLELLGPVSARRMFGGYGIYLDRTMNEMIEAGHQVTNDLTNITAVSCQDVAVPEVAAPRIDAGAYPNPFRAGTAIRFQAQAAGEVQLDLFDVNGRLVRTVARSASAWSCCESSGT